MGVDSGMVWSVLGVWGVVWVVMLVAAVVAIVVAVVALLRRRTATVLPGLPFFLDEAAVIAICEQGGYGDTAKRTVEEFVAENKDGSFGVDGRWFKFGGGGKRGREVRTTRDVLVTANAVLGMAMMALEAKHGVVHVDLSRQLILGNRAWRRTRSPLLAEIRDYVVVEGKFEMDGEAGEKPVLRAIVGAGPAGVRVVCDDLGLRREEIPEGRFNARCLGKCESWKDETGEIVIRPVAVLQ